jgi:phosphatidylinositol glycan class B
MTPEIVRDLRRSLLILTGVVIVTAWFSNLFYFPDEHFQILEFLSHKLGITAAADLPWEYASRIRPWMQPFLYYLIAKPLLLLGLRDLFDIVFVLRLVTGLLSVAALAVFAREVLATIEGADEQRAFVRYLPLFGFLPYLFVRTASETVSAAFFTLGLALVLRGGTARRFAAAGFLCGLAFECRFQSGILIAALFAWLVFIARSRMAALASFAAATLAAIGAGALVDRWGYGVWCFPPLGYFRVNILQGVAAKHFGSDPIFAYFYMIPAQMFALISAVLLIAMIVMWLRNPRHVLSWVTLPFFLLHCALGHKEPRFMFPLAIIATAFPVLAFSPRLPRWRNLAERVWSWRKGWAAKAVTAVSLLGMLFLAVYPFGIRPHMPMAQYIYRHFPHGLTAYSFDTPFMSYPMYRPQPFVSQKLTGKNELDGLLTKGPVFLFATTPTLPDNALPAHAHAALVYSEFPLSAWGYGAAGTRYLYDFAQFSARHAWLKFPSLCWMTLYRVERDSAIRP